MVYAGRLSATAAARNFYRKVSREKTVARLTQQQRPPTPRRIWIAEVSSSGGFLAGVYSVVLVEVRNRTIIEIYFVFPHVCSIETRLPAWSKWQYYLLREEKDRLSVSARITLLIAIRYVAKKLKQNIIRSILSFLAHARMFASLIDRGGKDRERRVKIRVISHISADKYVQSASIWQRVARKWGAKRERSAWCVEEGRGACAVQSARHREAVDRSAGRTARVIRACADSKSELARRAATNSRLPTTATAKVSMYE